MSEERAPEEQKKVIFKFIDLDNNSLPSIDTPREDIPKEILYRNTVILTQEAYDDLVKRADLGDGKWVGHWIGHDGNYICSCCRRDPLDFLEPLGLDGGSYMAIPMKYCPNCGIKMTETKE